METTANIALPYIMPSQAQKHVTHNEALRLLDAVVQLSVKDRHRTAPPSTPAEGERHIVAAGATGAWSGWDGDISLCVDGGWMRIPPQSGWRAWVEADGELWVLGVAGWTSLTGGDGAFETMGVNATADSVNRLAVAATSSLFNHDGAGHRLTVNKSAAGQTASLLFQTGFSGRAEIGTAGDDRLHFKVSADGATWRSALTVEGAAGKVALGGSQMNFSTLNLKGKTLPGGADDWFCITVANSEADNTAKGGAVLTGAAYANANKPFMVLGPWSDAISNGVFYGGGGWNCPEATMHRFYTGSHQPAVNNTATVALDITATTIDCGRPLRPLADNAHSLGASGRRWSVVHAATGTISTSDARLKEDVRPAALGLAFVLDLEPVAYRWKIGGHDIVQERIVDPEPRGEAGVEITIDRHVPRAGGRTHYGLLAQQVKAALATHGVDDFAGWTLADKNDPDSEQGLRYDQFVPILVRAVQELATEVAGLRAAV